MTSAEKLCLFNVSTTTYKAVNKHAITLDVLVPKELPPGDHPVLVTFHGGFLVREDPGTLRQRILTKRLDHRVKLISE